MTEEFRFFTSVHSRIVLTSDSPDIHILLWSKLFAHPVTTSVKCPLNMLTIVCTLEERINSRVHHRSCVFRLAVSVAVSKAYAKDSTANKNTDKITIRENNVITLIK